MKQNPERRTELAVLGARASARATIADRALPHARASDTLLNARAILFIALFLSLSACVKRERQIQSSANDRQTFASIPGTAKPESAPRININTASAAELERLPGIGAALAGRIIEHRSKYGPFRRSEHLIIVRGISDRRFRALRDLVTVD